MAVPGLLFRNFICARKNVKAVKEKQLGENRITIVIKRPPSYNLPEENHENYETFTPTLSSRH